MIKWDALEIIKEEQQLLQESEGGKLAGLGNVYVPGEGNSNDPDAFIIGEAPGAQETIKHRPFVGPSGRVLRDLMAFTGLYVTDQAVRGSEKFPETAGVVPANVWLTNVVKFRPPRNRQPYWIEVQASRPFLHNEWEAVNKPPIIIPIGGTALSAITGQQTSILRAAGKLHAYTSREGEPMFIWPMVHPAFGLRNPAARSLLEQDWEKFGEWFSATYQG